MLSLWIDFSWLTLFYHSPVVRFERLANFGQLEGPYAQWNLPKVRWGLGRESTIFVSSEEKMDRVLILNVCNFLHARQVLKVLINGKIIRSISLNVQKVGEFQKIKIPIQLKKDRNKILLKYSKWNKKKNKRRSAILFSQVKIE